MGATSAGLALGAVFEFKGKEYRISPWTYEIMGNFELYLQECALKNMRRMRELLTDEEYASLINQTRKDLDVGLYTFGNDAVSDALKSRLHLNRLILMCIQVNHPDITENTVNEMIVEIGDILLEKMNEANADPNVKGPKVL